MKKWILGGLLVCSFQVTAMELSVEKDDGVCELFEVNTQDSFENVFMQIAELRQNTSENEAIGDVHIEILQVGDQLKARIARAAAVAPAAVPVTRDYYEVVSTQDKSDISYILRTLSNDSLLSIASAKSNLKVSGDRIDHLHPFLFFKTVFSNEELKVCIRNLQGRSWVWREFLDGVVNSLKKESAAGNLTQAYLEDLAKNIGIEVGVLAPSVKAQKWEEFIGTMINKVPRKGDFARHRF